CVKDYYGGGLDAW
nr:immunoglobulin heavy chain junction region [Macaca mulatta]MOX01437.1 immunoglobulin heavy chain junction region [Macaca mulatta]MOX05029.1 immunoglobulin heavy chain junction region [Macaca mulatta]